ncbi:MAG: right-handed parallel beta-helix repeat-containing protein [Phaeodactylibacter sp.]|nr:right-handed parallel beta-helix repeat-containing protein [Phaeodactylibacter sp.]
MNMHSIPNDRTALENSSFQYSHGLSTGWFPRAILAIFLVLLASAASWATTYYVDAQNGNDNNDGLSATFTGEGAGPWKTISKVNSTLFAPGDSILFKRGAVWTDGPLEPMNGGAPGGAITIQETVVGEPLTFDLVDPNNHNCVYFGAYGAATEKPKIDCQGGRGVIIEHNYIIVEGLHLDNGDNNVLWLNRADGTRWVNIFDVDVTRSNANAVRSNEGGSNIWLKGLYVYDYGVNGILLSGSPNNLLKHVLVEECHVENPVTADLEDAITCHQGENTWDLEGYIIIRNNTIRRAGEDGIDVTSGTHVLLDGNDIRYSFSAGILLSKPWVNTIEVRNNFLFSNSFDRGNGDLSIRVSNVWAFNNIIAGNGHNCLSFSDTDNTKFWNNVISPMNRTGDLIRFTENVGSVELKNNIFDFSAVDQEIHIETPSNSIVFDYNCYYGMSMGQEIYENYSFQEYRNANPLFEPNGFWGNPEFVRPGRTSPDYFRLAATSPCIDRGITVPITEDFWGTLRPQGAGIDIGVYEQSALDCNPDPSITIYPGDPCDDGDPTTINDAIDDNCNCTGAPTPCTGIGDADGDGVCSNADCDDNDPGIAHQPGDPCDDGDPNTVGETIQADCSCGGGATGAPIVLTCARIASSEADGEEHASGYVSLNSTDLELAEDPGRGNQVIGLRFSNLNIPQGATIVSASIQFTVEDDENDNPCNLTITGKASDNPGNFQASFQNISTRPRTAASVSWAPAEWQNIGDRGPDQQTPDLSAVIQEIVDRNGYFSGSSIVLFIQGTGRRVAESFDGNDNLAPELCVEYTTATATFDCPARMANIGDLCNDGNPNTINDAIDDNCNCAGAPVSCPGTGDADGDGICADVDCDDNNANITTQDADGDGVCADVDCDDNDASITSYTGQACDDGDNTTINDQVDGDCNCVGTPTPCTGAGDADGDGVCADVDCDDNDASVTTRDADGDGLCDDVDCDDDDAAVNYQPGDACDDGDNTTINDVVGNNCNCAGAPTACTGIGDADGDGICADVDCDDNDASITSYTGQACDDGDNTTIDDRLDDNCNCAGIPTDCTGDGDADGDGVCADVDCDDNDASIISYTGQACDDGDNTTINDRLDDNCNCVGAPTACTGIGDADGDGVCADVDCDDNDPAVRSRDADGDGICDDVDCDDNDAAVNYQPGDACDDGDITTINDVIGNNCNCAGVPTACTGIGDADGDGICADVDCDDNDPAVRSRDADGDGLCDDVDCDDNDPNVTSQPGDACNDGDNTTVNDILDANCNCAGVPTACTGIGDMDGDGICADVDCNDLNPNITTQPDQPCDDGDPNTINDIIDADCNCTGTPVPCPGSVDADRDGLCADVECNDNDPNVTYQPGDPCNDGNPNTTGETIQADCSCGGGSTGVAPTLTCSRINDVRDDAEQQPFGQIRLASNDLELGSDPYSGEQIIGMRFDGLNIPRGAYITSARIQFTTENPNNENPARLTIYGEASNDAQSFRGSMFNISSRPRTNASAVWMPSVWNTVGEAGLAQQSPDLSAILQEIVNRSGFSSNSAVVLIIAGTGRRSAESFEGFASRAPQLCVEYFDTPPAFDCPALSGDYGAPCDDGNPNTYNDSIDANCNCTGAPTPCPGIGDADGDGVCADVDCDDSNPNIGDQIGSECDDGNPNTIGETIQADCSCGGGAAVPAFSCARVSRSADDAAEGANGQVSLTGSDLAMATAGNGGSLLAGMRFSGLGIPRGARILKASIQFTVEGPRDEGFCHLRAYGEASDDAESFGGGSHNISIRPATNASVEWMPSGWLLPGQAGYAQQSPDLSSILQEIVNRSGYTSASSVAIMIDGIGRRPARAFDGAMAQAPELCVEYIAPGNARPAPDDGAPPTETWEEEDEERYARVTALSVVDELSVYPNPATDRLTLSFSSTFEGRARIQAISMNGKVALLEEREIHRGKNVVSLEGLSLPDGIYALQIIAGEAVQSGKFIIMKE